MSQYCYPERKNTTKNTKGKKSTKKDKRNVDTDVSLEMEIDVNSSPSILYMCNILKTEIKMFLVLFYAFLGLESAARLSR